MTTPFSMFDWRGCLYGLWIKGLISRCIYWHSTLGKDSFPVVLMENYLSGSILSLVAVGDTHPDKRLCVEIRRMICQPEIIGTQKNGHEIMMNSLLCYQGCRQINDFWKLLDLSCILIHIFAFSVMWSIRHIFDIIHSAIYEGNWNCQLFNSLLRNLSYLENVVNWEENVWGIGL